MCCVWSNGLPAAVKLLACETTRCKCFAWVLMQVVEFQVSCHGPPMFRHIFWQQQHGGQHTIHQSAWTFQGGGCQLVSATLHRLHFAAERCLCRDSLLWIARTEWTGPTMELMNSQVCFLLDRLFHVDCVGPLFDCLCLSFPRVRKGGDAVSSHRIGVGMIQLTRSKGFGVWCGVSG